MPERFGAFRGWAGLGRAGLGWAVGWAGLGWAGLDWAGSARELLAVASSSLGILRYSEEFNFGPEVDLFASHLDQQSFNFSRESIFLWHPGDHMRLKRKPPLTSHQMASKLTSPYILNITVCSCR